MGRTERPGGAGDRALAAWRVPVVPAVGDEHGDNGDDQKPRGQTASRRAGGRPPEAVDGGARAGGAGLGRESPDPVIGRRWASLHRARPSARPPPPSPGGAARGSETRSRRPHPSDLVGKGGFEPPASASRTLRANQAALLPGPDDATRPVPRPDRGRSWCRAKYSPASRAATALRSRMGSSGLDEPSLGPRAAGHEHVGPAVEQHEHRARARAGRRRTSSRRSREMAMPPMVPICRSRMTRSAGSGVHARPGRPAPRRTHADGGVRRPSRTDRNSS